MGASNSGSDSGFESDFESDSGSRNTSLTFLDLPKKLRELIWGFAMPPYYAKPQVHFFNVGKGVESRIKTQWEGSSQRKLCWTFDSLCPPDCHGGQTARVDDWAHEDNHSAYLVVSSLWEVCPESRAVMERHFKRHYKKRFKKEDPRAVTVTFIRESNNRCITTRPGIDLMHMSTGSLANISDNIYPFTEFFDR